METKTKGKRDEGTGKKEKLKKEKALSKHWEMMKWVTQFIDENGRRNK